MSKRSTLLVASLSLLVLCASVTTKESFTRIATKENTIFDIEYSNAGEVLLIADGTEVNWYSSKNYELLSSSTGGHSEQIMAIDLSSDSTWLISGGKDSTIVLWDVKKNSIKEELNYHKGIITTLKFSPNNQYILSGSSDGHTILYDRVNQKISQSIKHNGDVLTVAISPNQKTFCVGGRNGVQLFDFDTGSLIKTLSTNKWIREVSYNKNGERIIFCGDNSKVESWSIKELDKIYNLDSFKFTNDWLCSIKWNEDNNSFVTGGAKGVVKISTPFSRYVTKIDVMANDIEFTPNIGNYLKIAIATHGKGVVIYDAKNMKSTKK